MDPVVGGWDLVGIILACIAVGGVGGLAYDLTEPIIRRRTTSGDPESKPEDGFGDNRIAMPRLRKTSQRRVLEAGFLGPMTVGATAAIAAVFALGIVRPDVPPQIDRDAVVRELTSRSTNAATVAAVKRVLSEPRDAYVTWERLILLGLVAGFGGVAVVRSLRARLITAIGGVAFDARVAGIREGAEVSKSVVAEKAADESTDTVDSSAKETLDPAIESAVDLHVEKLASMSLYGNPTFS